MCLLVLGLLLFLGVHSVRIVADGWRTRGIARLGAGRWKGLYALLSLLGLALIVWGWALARRQPVVWWVPPAGLRHLNALFTLAAFVLLAAAYVPGNLVKARLRHPKVLGVALWALGHLLASGSGAGLLLFGAFLAWAVYDRISVKKRGAKGPLGDRHGGVTNDIIAVVVGILLYLAMFRWGHPLLIGVPLA